MKKLILSIAALGAVILTLGLTAGGTSVLAVEPTPRPRVGPTYTLRTDIACSPMTNAQAYRDSAGVLRLVTEGTPQKCRIRVRNYTAQPITGITVTHATKNTLVNTTYAGPFTLAPGGSLTIVENLTFNKSQDGRGKTTATATGILAGATVTSTATEQSSLP